MSFLPEYFLSHVANTWILCWTAAEALGLLQFKAFLSIDGSMVFCVFMHACVCVCVLAQLCLTPAIP